MSDLNEWIPLSEAARRASYTGAYINLLCRTGQLECRKIGRNWMTTKTDVNGLLIKHSRRRHYNVNPLALTAALVLFIFGFYLAFDSNSPPLDSQVSSIFPIDKTATAHFAIHRNRTGGLYWFESSYGGKNTDRDTVIASVSIKIAGRRAIAGEETFRDLSLPLILDTQTSFDVAEPLRGGDVIANFDIAAGRVIQSAPVSAPVSSVSVSAASLTNIDTSQFALKSDLAAVTTASITKIVTTPLADTGVSAGSYGTANAVASFTVDVKGRLTAAANTPISVTNSMLAGSIAASKLVGTDITTVGTITTGIWQGAAVAASYGGTGQSSYTTGDMLYASGSSALSKLGIGSSGQCLTVSSGLPAWGSCSSTTAGVTSLTGTSNQITVSASTGDITLSLPQSIATSSTPTFGGLALSSVLAVSSGGTGVATLNDLIILGTHTTGNYIATASASSPISVSGSGNESAAVTIACSTCLTSTSGGVFAVTLAGTSGTSQTISAGDTITIAAGTGITTTAGATDTVTVATSQNIATSASPTFSTLNLSASSNQLVLQSGGVTGTLTWTAASSNKTLTLPNATDTLIGKDTTDTLTNKTLTNAAFNGTTPITVTQGAASSGSPTGLTFTGGAHTTLAASTESPDVNFNLARTVQFSTGALTTQRAVEIQAPTYAFVGASTLTNAATLYIDAAPTAGTNATITNPYALWVDAGNVRFDGSVIYQGTNLYIHNTGTSNFFAGVGAGNLTTSGNGLNVGLGVSALASITTGEGVTAVGDLALNHNTSGSSNTAIGQAALTSSTTSNNNTAVGASALQSNTTGGSNTAVGLSAFQSNTTGSSNVALGVSTGTSNTIGSYNIIIGTSSNVNANNLDTTIIVGYAATATASNQLVIGSNNASGSITDAYLGQGVTKTSAPAGITLNATGGSGTNIAGASLTFAGGKGTGTGNAGTIIFQAPVAKNASGTSAQSLTTILTIGNTQSTHPGLAGAVINAPAVTWTDANTAGSGTATNAVAYGLQQPTFAATNTLVTTTNAATVYIAAAPTAGTNQTLTNAYALWVDAGNVRFDGTIITNSQGAFQIEPYNTAIGNTGEQRFLELAANGTNYVGFKAPDNIAANKVWVLPNADSTGTQCLGSDGSLSLSWQTCSGGTGAPTDATYVTLSNNASLSAERVLTGTSNQITLTDGGVNGTITLSTPQDIATASTPQFTRLGIGAAADGTSKLLLSGNATASAWGLNGIYSQAAAATFTDSSTLASGTATNAVFNSFAQPTLAASNASVTTTNAATVYIAAAPTAGTNQTLTNAYALWVDAGNVRFDGVILAGSTPTTLTDSAGKILSAALNTVAVGQGGTGQTSYTDGQLLIGNSTGNTLAKATLTGTSNQITVTNGSGTITLSTPQDIATASTPQFTRLGIGAAADSVNLLTLTQAAASSGSPTALTLTGGAHTTLTAGIESPDVYFSLARNVQFGTGNLVRQRAIRIDGPTYRFVAASTITDGITMAITGAPGEGTNATITSPIALDLDGTTQIASAAGSLPSALRIPAYTLTLTGTTQMTSVGPAAARINQMTITDTSAVTVNSAASLYIANAPVAGGSVTLTNAYALWVDAGNVRFDGVILAGSTPTTLTDSAGKILSAALNTVAVGQGGTGQTSYTDGQLLIGNSTGNTLAKATLTGTSNQITVTNGSGTITLSTPQDIATASTPQFTRLGIGAAADGTSKLLLSGNATASAWGLNGIYSQAAAATFTDSSTLASGTATNAVFNSFAQPTLAASNASVTTTNAATVYIAAAPTAGTNQTLTNAYALWVDAGNVRFDGTIITNSQGAFQIEPYNTAIGNTGEQRFLELAANGTNYVGFKAPDNIAANKVWVLPNADSTGTQCLASDGALALSWTACSGGSGTPGGSGSEIQYRGGASTFSAISGSSVGSTGTITLAPTASSSGSPVLLTLTGPAHTTLTASTEASDVNFNLARTVQFATGALTTQRAVKILAPTYGFVGASTLTNAATLYIDAAPTAGTNATITNAYALWVDAGNVRFDGAVIHTASSAFTIDGAVWNDSTQKTLSVYVDGIQQQLAGTLFTSTASATVSNTTTETSIIGTGVGTTTLPANFLVAGKTIRVTVTGYFSTGLSSATIRIRVKLGGTIVLTTPAQIPSGNESNQRFTVNGIITARTTGATGSVFGQGVAIFYLNANSIDQNLEMVNTAATTIDTTASQKVDVMATWGTGTDASDSITGTNVIVEALN